MQTTTSTYDNILAGNYSVETKASINGTEYGMNDLISMNSELSAFASSTPSVGGCISGQLIVKMKDPGVSFPKQAVVLPYARLKAADGTTSEWLQQGKYFVDKVSTDATGVTTITCYDVIVKMEQPMHTSPDAATGYPKVAMTVAGEVATRLGTSVESYTLLNIMTYPYMVQFPGIGNTGYTMREVMGFIAAMYGSNWVSNYEGKLRLVEFKASRGDLLINEESKRLVFGGDTYIEV